MTKVYRTVSSSMQGIKILAHVHNKFVKIGSYSLLMHMLTGLVQCHASSFAATALRLMQMEVWSEF